MVVLRKTADATEVVLVHAPYPGRLKFQGLSSSLFAARCAPETLVVVGCPHENSVDRKSAMALDGVHLSIAGDAESALRSVLESFLSQNRGAVEFVRELTPGLFRSGQVGGRFTIACTAWPATLSFDNGPSRYRDSRPLVFPETYPNFDVFDTPATIPVMVSRGCPYGRCTFCAEANRDGTVTRTADYDWLFELAHRVPGASLYFQDSIFPGGNGARSDLLPRLRGLGREWGCQVFLPMLTEQRVAELAEHGCTYLYTGVEPEALVAFGMIPELIGHFATIRRLRRLSPPELERVPVEPEGAVLRRAAAFFSRHGAELRVPSGAVRAIASKAATLGTGARALDAVATNVLEPTIWRFLQSDHDVQRIVVTQDTVKRGQRAQFHSVEGHQGKCDVAALVQHAFERLGEDRTLRITNTRGWTDDQLRERIEETVATLEFDDAPESAKIWWRRFENDHELRPRTVLRLAAELACRQATVSELFLAFVYSNTQNLQAVLHYLDYRRLRDKEERAARGGIVGGIVGGSLSPFTVVTSRPLSPRGPICWFWPDAGAFWPGFSPLLAFFAMFATPEFTTTAFVLPDMTNSSTLGPRERRSPNCDAFVSFLYTESSCHRQLPAREILLTACGMSGNAKG